MRLRNQLPLLILFFISAATLIVYYRLTKIPYLTFSDAAIFGDVARNILSGAYQSNFQYFVNLGKGISDLIPPVYPYIVALNFQLFGISDISIILTSGAFYLLSVIGVYLLAQKVFGKLVGFLAGVAVAFNISILDYATTGASEPLFIFEIILAAYLFLFRKKWTNILGFLVLILMYYTRAQSIIYIVGFLLLFLLLNFPLKRAVKYFLGIVVIGLLFIFFTSEQGIFAVTQILPGVSSSESLRGAIQEVSIVAILKKVLYNLYNLYILLPQIASPYLWALFLIGIVRWGRDRVENSFKTSVIFMVVATFIGAALTIPLYRYIHPVIPLVYILAIESLVWILHAVFVRNEVAANRNSRTMVITRVAILLTLLFVVGQTIGYIFLDSRFKSKTVNEGKPPVYVTLSKILKKNTPPESVIVTNLDAWGTWYGERKTVWYPLEPQLLENKSGNLPDAIFLTNYLMDDENYYMGEEWRKIFESPDNIENEFIAEDYELAGVYSIPAEETYQKQDARAVLLMRK